jgi:hypothetical protein
MGLRELRHRERGIEPSVRTLLDGEAMEMQQMLDPQHQDHRAMQEMSASVLANDPIYRIAGWHRTTYDHDDGRVQALPSLQSRYYPRDDRQRVHEMAVAVSGDPQTRTDDRFYSGRPQIANGVEFILIGKHIIIERPQVPQNVTSGWQDPRDLRRLPRQRVLLHQRRMQGPQLHQPISRCAILLRQVRDGRRLLRNRCRTEVSGTPLPLITDRQPERSRLVSHLRRE